MTSGHSTAKDIWSECTRHNAKHSLYQINGVQFQQKGWKTIEEQLSEETMATMRTLRKHIRKHFSGCSKNCEPTSYFLYQALDMKQQKRILREERWTGDTWFKAKRGTPLAGNTKPMPALPATRTTVPAAANPAPAQAAEHPTGRMRHTTKQPPYDPTATGSTSLPHPRSVPPTADYWIKEGHLRKRIHVKPRHDLYTPQQTDDGPDVTRLTTEQWSTMVQDR